MRFDDLTPGEIVARVYSSFEPAPMWDADRLRGLRAESLPRLYCPDCRKHGTILRGDMYEPPRRNPANADKQPSEHANWFCCQCKTWHKRPLQLRQRGEIGGNQSRSHKDGDWKIVDGIGAGKIISAIDLSPNAVRLWSLWTHTHIGTNAMQNTLVEHALCEADKAGIDRPKSFAEGRSALVLAIMVSADARSRARNGLALHTPEALAAAIRVHRSQMVKDRRWGRLQAMLVEIYDGLELEMARVVIGAIRAPLSDIA